ncbi:MAG: hypothetical protein IT289_07045 [Oligoflexia bacterium]|nr:hypothetical protein [Oligoflexia bacterium]
MKKQILIVLFMILGSISYANEIDLESKELKSKDVRLFYIVNRGTDVVTLPLEKKFDETPRFILGHDGNLHALTGLISLTQDQTLPWHCEDQEMAPSMSGAVLENSTEAQGLIMAMGKNAKEVLKWAPSRPVELRQLPKCVLEGKPVHSFELFDSAHDSMKLFIGRTADFSAAGFIDHFGKCYLVFKPRSPLSVKVTYLGTLLIGKKAKGDAWRFYQFKSDTEEGVIAAKWNYAPRKGPTSTKVILRYVKSCQKKN